MKIGFIDYQLKNYHADKFHTILTGDVGKAANAELVAAYEEVPAANYDWCREKGVARAATAQEVVEKSDALIVLAPDAIEKHLRLGEAALKSGKPTLIDKYLSTTTADAKQMLEIAREHNTPLMSSSSLRFSVELEELLPKVGAVETMFSRGFGEWRGYSVHTIAPVVRVMGAGVKRIIDTGNDLTSLVTLDYGDRKAFVEVRKSENMYEATPWQVGILSEGKYHVATIAKFDEFYANLMKEFLKFAKSGQSPTPPDEMMKTVIIEEAAEQSRNRGGEWVTV